MDVVSAAASIGAIVELTGKVVSYLSSVKNAPKERKRWALEASNLANALLNLQFRLEEAEPHEPWYTAVRALSVENGLLDQYKVALENLYSKVVVDGGTFSKIGGAVAWKFTQKDVTEIMSRLERLQHIVQIALEHDHLYVLAHPPFGVQRLTRASKLARAIKDVSNTIQNDTKSIRAATMAIDDKVTTVQDEHNRKRNLEILEWLSPAIHWATHQDIIDRRQEGTGQWFVDDPAFDNWVKIPGSTLLCPGIPGAGKTMMASIALDHLLKKQSNDISLACLFCNHKSQDREGVDELFAAMLKQLLHARPSLPESMIALYQGHTVKKTRPSLQEVLRELHVQLASPRATFLVVDALDECSDRHGARGRFMKELLTLSEKFDLNLMVTSRFIPDVMEAFSNAVRLEVRASRDDVKRYVTGRIPVLPKCIGRDAGLQQLVQERIAETVDGMLVYHYHSGWISGC